MSGHTNSQGPSWDSNVYVITTTRILILMGTAYLVRSLYNLVSPTWSSRAASIVAGEPFFPSCPPSSVNSEWLTILLVP